MSAAVATPYNAMRLGRDVRLASRRYGPAYGLIAYPVCWLQAPRDPSEKLGLLIENLFCRAVMSINEKRYTHFIFFCCVSGKMEFPDMAERKFGEILFGAVVVIGGGDVDIVDIQ